MVGSFRAFLSVSEIASALQVQYATPRHRASFRKNQLPINEISGGRFHERLQSAGPAVCFGARALDDSGGECNRSNEQRQHRGNGDGQNGRSGSERLGKSIQHRSRGRYAGDQDRRRGDLSNFGAASRKVQGDDRGGRFFADNYQRPGRARIAGNERERGVGRERGGFHDYGGSERRAGIADAIRRDQRQSCYRGNGKPSVFFRQSTGTADDGARDSSIKFPRRFHKQWNRIFGQRSTTAREQFPSGRAGQQ